MRCEMMRSSLPLIHKYPKKPQPLVQRVGKSEGPLLEESAISIDECWMWVVVGSVLGISGWSGWNRWSGFGTTRSGGRERKVYRWMKKRGERRIIRLARGRAGV